MSKIESLVSLMSSMGIASPKDLVGVPLIEIQKLEHHMGIKFPRMYKDYLLKFGRSAGYLAPWMAIYFDDLLEIRENYELLIAQSDSAFRLPPKALLIANLDCVFDFIMCGGKDDPIVYRIDLSNCDNIAVKQYGSSFFKYLETTIRYADTDAIPQEVFDEQLDLALDSLMNY